MEIGYQPFYHLQALQFPRNNHHGGFPLMFYLRSVAILPSRNLGLVTETLTTAVPVSRPQHHPFEVGQCYLRSFVLSSTPQKGFPMTNLLE
jgi:hypothetical protein